MNGSFLVAEASSIEEVKKIVESDAYYINNIVSWLRLDGTVPLT
jgi:uncharacterized protein YciI